MLFDEKSRVALRARLYPPDKDFLSVALDDYLVRYGLSSIVKNLNEEQLLVVARKIYAEEQSFKTKLVEGIKDLCIATDLIPDRWEYGPIRPPEIYPEYIGEPIDFSYANLISVSGRIILTLSREVGHFNPEGSVHFKINTSYTNFICGIPNMRIQQVYDNIFSETIIAHNEREFNGFIERLVGALKNVCHVTEVNEEVLRSIDKENFLKLKVKCETYDK